MPTIEITLAAQEDNMGVTRTGPALSPAAPQAYGFLGYNSSAHKGVGLRFLNVTVPNGATISSAYVKLYAYATMSSDYERWQVIGDDEDNAAAWTTVADFQARRGTDLGGADNSKRTTAYVNWDDEEPWTANVGYSSPDIKDVIQEIVSRPGWSSGNALALWVDDYAGRTGHVYGRYRTARFYGTATPRYPAVLTITYEVPGVAPTVTTQAVSDMDKTTATGNGNVTDDGGSAITERGVCYCLAADGTPDTSDDKDTAEGTTGAFTTSMTGLTPLSDYHARAYAINAIGTSYGELVEFSTLMSATYVEILTADRALALDNTTVFTPDADYEPATKKYVDDLLPNRNAIINGSFAVAQRGVGPFTSETTPLNSDDTYLLDRWTLLADGDDIVDVSQEASTTITDPHFNIKLDVETANKKFGIVTILENKDARRLTNQAVSLSFKAKGTKVGATLTVNAIRAAVLSWNSTADAVTSDVVSVWETAGTNPTLAANWTYENTPTALAALTESWQSFSITGILMDTAGVTNIAVFIWADDVTMDVGDFLQIAEVQLEIGSAATPFEYLPFQDELALCQRYCFGLTTVALAENIAFGLAASTTEAYCSLWLPVAMRGVPSLVATASDYKLYDTVNAATDVTALVIDDKTMSNNVMVTLKASTASGLTQYRPYYLVGNGTGSRVLSLTSEL